MLAFILRRKWAMGNDTEKMLGTPTLIIVGAGAILSAFLFHFMFKYADEKNLLMVLLTALLIAVVSIGVVKSLVYTSKQKYSK
jgi:membrane associated rhomboid family serine protease